MFNFLEFPLKYIKQHELVENRLPESCPIHIYNLSSIIKTQLTD